MALFDIANIIGVPFDQFKLLLCSLLALPLGFLNYYITNPSIRLLYGFITGICIQYYMFGNQIIHMIVSTLITYLFLQFCSRKKKVPGLPFLNRFLSPFTILTYTLLHLSCLHIYRMITTYGGWDMDITTIYMMSICKFSSLVFSYEDGSEENISTLINKYHKSKVIVDCPTCLEMFSYIFYYSSAVVGPSFEFSDFRDFINMEKEYKAIPMQSSIQKGFIELGKAFSSLFIMIILSKYFHYHYVITEEFGKTALLYKLFYISVSMIGFRSKFYTIWKLTTAGCILNGLSYGVIINEKTGEKKEHFDKIKHTEINSVELNTVTRVKIEYWNHTVHLWLKYNVMLRLINLPDQYKFFKVNRNFITFMCSSFWHGFYPMYYLSFFDFYLINWVSEILEKDFNFFDYIDNKSFILYTFEYNNEKYNIRPLSTIVNRIVLHTFDYRGISFSLILLEDIVKYFKNLYFLPNIFLFVLTIVMIILKKCLVKKSSAFTPIGPASGGVVNVEKVEKKE